MDADATARAFASAQKCLWLTKAEAELISDGFKVSAPLSRSLALKVMGLVMEWAADDDVRAAEALVSACSRQTHADGSPERS